MSAQPSLGRSFQLFLVATSLATIATACIRFALSWHIVKVTGSATLFASIIAASHFAEVYSKPILAPLGDCFARLKVLRYSFVISLVLAVMLLLALFGTAFSAPLLAGLLIAMSFINGLRDPAAAALVPSLVSPAQLTQAQSLRSTVASAIGLGGSILGGLVTAASDPVTAILSGCLLLALGAVIVLGVRANSDPGSQVSFGTFLRTWHRRTIDGLKAIVKTRAELLNALAAALLNVGVTPLTTLLMPLWVIQSLGGSPRMLAAFETALGVGVIVGSYQGPKRLNPLLGKHMTATLGTLAMGATIVVASVLTNPYAIAGCMFVAGFCFTLFLVNGSALRAAATPGPFRARMIGGWAFIATGFYPFASQASGALTERFSAPVVVALSGVCVILAGVVIALNRDARRLWSQPEADIVGAYERLYPDAFRPKG